MPQRGEKVCYVDVSGREIRDLTLEEFNVYRVWKAFNTLTRDSWKIIGWTTTIRCNDYNIRNGGYGPIVWKPNSNFTIGKGTARHNFNGRGYEGQLVITFFEDMGQRTITGVYEIFEPGRGGSGAAGGGHHGGRGERGGGRSNLSTRLFFQ